MTMETSHGSGERDAAAGNASAPRGDAALQTRLAGLKKVRFHQLVTLIEMQSGAARPIGQLTDPTTEAIRFRAARSLSFGPGDIAEISRDEADDRLEVRVNFFGLYGPASPLPPYFTERIIEEDQTPSTVEDLFDLFNHRLISLLHVVWRKYRYYLRYETGGADPLSKRFLALCGFPIEDRPRIGQISRSALLPHVGLMSLYSSSAGVVGSTLSNFFKIPCRIEEFIPREVMIGPESRLSLGRANTTLGEDAVLGFQLEDRLGKFRICLGPADFATLAPFLPDGMRHRQLAELLSMINREPLEWDLSVAFEPDTIPMTRLGEARLGWSSWLGARNGERLENPILLAAVEDNGQDGALETDDDLAGWAAHDGNRDHGLRHEEAMA